MPDGPHFLVVSEPEPGVREYEIEHPGCPTHEPHGQPPEGIPLSLAYDCEVGRIADSGIEYVVADIVKLAPGRYPIHAEFSHSPSTVNGPEEWDAWLEVGESS